MIETRRLENVVIFTQTIHQHIYHFKQYYFLLDIHKLIFLLSHSILSMTDFRLILHYKSMSLSLSYLVTSLCLNHCVIYIIESTNDLLLVGQNYTCFFVCVEPNFMTESSGSKFYQFIHVVFCPLQVGY